MSPLAYAGVAYLAVLVLLVAFFARVYWVNTAAEREKAREARQERTGIRPTRLRLVNTAAIDGSDDGC